MAHHFRADRPDDGRAAGPVGRRRTAPGVPATVAAARSGEPT